MWVPLSVGLVNLVEFTSTVKSFLTSFILYSSAYFGIRYPPPPPSKNPAMIKGRNSLLERVQPFHAYG